MASNASLKLEGVPGELLLAAAIEGNREFIEEPPPAKPLSWRPCPACGKRFKDLLQHSSTGVCTCDQCGLVLCSAFKLRQHMRLEHLSFCPPKLTPTSEKQPDSKLSSCAVCGESFNYKYLLKHVRKAHRSTDSVVRRRFCCHLCDAKMVGEHALRRHIKYIHERAPRTQKCEVCGEEFETIELLKEHRFKHRMKVAKPFQCSECPARVSRMDVLKMHLLKKHGINRFSDLSHLHGADKFTKLAGAAKGLTREEKRALKLQPPLPEPRPSAKTTKLGCSYCLKEFSDAFHLSRHITNVHLGLRQFSCNQCGKTYKTKWLADKHVDTVHKTDPCTARCAICLKGFRKYKTHDLLDHLDKHTGFATASPERFDFTCTLCRHGFMRRQLAKDHPVKCHVGGRFKCKQCRAPFIHVHRLVDHIVSTHVYKDGGGKLLKCSHCLLAFGASANLIEHLSYHFKAMPFTCSACNAGFRSLASLKQHAFQKHSHDTRITSCLICAEPLSTKNIVKHFLEH